MSATGLTLCPVLGTILAVMAEKRSRPANPANHPDCGASSLLLQDD
jgi:hypothetical protein